MQEEDIQPLKNKLDETDDMFLLADIYLYIGLLLEQNDFPIGKYKLWREEQKIK